MSNERDLIALHIYSYRERESCNTTAVGSNFSAIINNYRTQILSLSLSCFFHPPPKQQRLPPQAPQTESARSPPKFNDFFLSALQTLKNKKETPFPFFFSLSPWRFPSPSPSRSSATCCWCCCCCCCYLSIYLYIYYFPIHVNTSLKNFSINPFRTTNMETLETLPPPPPPPPAAAAAQQQRESGVLVSSGSVDEPLVVVTSMKTMTTTTECRGRGEVHDQGSNGVNEGGGSGVADQLGGGGGGVENVSAMDENKKDDGSLQLNGDDDDSGGVRKVQVSGEDGISLVVEVQGGSACMVQQEMIGSGSEVGERSNGAQKSLLEADTTTGKEDTLKDVQKEEEEGGDDEEEEDHNHGFSVGDLVWAKIKSHPWWPGLIYDPSDASKSAAKCRRKEDRLLVAYFGDHSFAWCDPSQLKSFQENFEKMSMQSNSESFLNAVEASVDEIGRRVELRMTCACVPTENQTGQGRPLTVNAGINEGVAVPKGGSGEFSVTQFEPVKFLAHLRDIAEVVSITNMLEVTLLRRQLLAFNRTRGYNQLPLYNGPRGRRAPEDSSGNGITSKSDLNEQAEELTESPPEADWITNPEFGKMSTGNWPGISEDKLYQRKKQRTMAEIMANDMDVEPENCGGDGSEDGTVDKQMSTTSRKRKKNKDLEVGAVDDLAEEGSGSGKSDPMSKKPKKTNLSGSPTAVEEEKEISGKLFDIGGREGSKTRERKRSKYLSYPYTSLSKETNYFLSWADPANEIPKADRVVDVQIQLTGSPPIVKCSGETFQKKLGESPGNLSDQTPNKQKNIMFKNAKVSPDEMLSEILSAALDPFYLKENNSYRSVKGFFTTFRGSLYREGFNYEIFSNYMADRCDEKKQTPDNKLVSPAKDSHEVGHRTSNGESKPKRKRKDEAMLQSPRPESEHAAGTVEPKRKRKKGKDEAKLRSSQSKSEHVAGTVESQPKEIKRKDEAMLQSPQSKSKDEVGPVEPKPKEIRMKDEEMLQNPQSKLEPKAGTVEPKLRRRRKKNEMLQSPEGKLEHAAGKLESKRKRIRRKDEARLQNPQSKVEHAADTVNMKQNDNEKDNGDNSGAALLLTFAAGVSLPSKDDLVTVFGKFGALNELETNVLQDSCSAQVVYVRTSDAETAFNSSGKISQFGPEMVTYRLRYLSTTSKASKHGASSNQVLPTTSPSLVVGDQTPANQPASGLPPASDAPPLLFIKQNLEMMTNLLERSGNNLSPGTRAKLEGEIKGLLKKVATMSDSSSS